MKLWKHLINGILSGITEKKSNYAWNSRNCRRDDGASWPTCMGHTLALNLTDWDPRCMQFDALACWKCCWLVVAKSFVMAFFQSLVAGGFSCSWCGWGALMSMCFMGWPCEASWGTAAVLRGKMSPFLRQCKKFPFVESVLHRISSWEPLVSLLCGGPEPCVCAGRAGTVGALAEVCHLMAPLLAGCPHLPYSTPAPP